jgi:hypothetical protein
VGCPVAPSVPTSITRFRDCDQQRSSVKPAYQFSKYYYLRIKGESLYGEFPR